MKAHLLMRGKKEGKRSPGRPRQDYPPNSKDDNYCHLQERKRKGKGLRYWQVRPQNRRSGPVWTEGKKDEQFI